MAKSKDKTGLFGAVDDAAPSPHRAFVSAFDRAYRARYRVPYPWRKCDFGYVPVILQALGNDPAGAERVVAAYFADGTPRYEGHDLRLLYFDLSRFLVRAAKQIGNNAARVAAGRREDAIL